MRDESELPLFHGPHVPAVRFRNAMEDLDLRAALSGCPAEWSGVLREMAAAQKSAGGRPDRKQLLNARRDDWPELFERTWQRLMGRALDSRGIPGVLVTPRPEYHAVNNLLSAAGRER
jgi:hypothetical protein